MPTSPAAPGASTFRLYDTVQVGLKPKLALDTLGGISWTAATFSSTPWDLGPTSITPVSAICFGIVAVDRRDLNSNGSNCVSSAAIRRDLPGVRSDPAIGCQ